MVRIESRRPAAKWKHTSDGSLSSPRSESPLSSNLKEERLRPVSASALSRFEQWGRAAFDQPAAMSPRSSSAALLFAPPNGKTTLTGRPLDMVELPIVQAAPQAVQKMGRSQVASSSNRHKGHTTIASRDPAVKAPIKFAQRVQESTVGKHASDASANNNPWSTHLTRHPEPGQTKPKRGDRQKKVVADLHAHMSESDIQMGTIKPKPTELDDHAAKHTEGARPVRARNLLRAAIQTVLVAGTTNGMKRKGKPRSSHKSKSREEYGEAHRAMRVRLIDREAHALSAAEDYVELAFQ